MHISKADMERELKLSVVPWLRGRGITGAGTSCTRLTSNQSKGLLSAQKSGREHLIMRDG